QIKVPRDQDAELMLAEGALLFARAADAVPSKDVPTLDRLAKLLADETVATIDRLEAAGDPDVADVLERHPLRDLLTLSEWYPLTV
ncbi:maltotransferase domain-containing protein, partial [Actinomadura livida]